MANTSRGEPPSVGRPGDVAVPSAIVVMMPVEALITRTLRSARYKFPAASNAKSIKLYSWAAVAGPPSPARPCVPVPATSESANVCGSTRHIFKFL